MTRIGILLLSFISLTACHTVTQQTVTQQTVTHQAVPKEVKQLVQKRQTCLQSQLKYANEKSVTITEEQFLQGCDNRTLAKEFRMMREKYQHNLAAINLLDSYADFD